MQIDSLRRDEATTYQITVYAEGHASDTAAPGQFVRAIRAMRGTLGQVQIKTYERGRPERVPQAPPDVAPTLARAFPPNHETPVRWGDLPRPAPVPVAATVARVEPSNAPPLLPPEPLPEFDPAMPRAATPEVADAPEIDPAVQQAQFPGGADEPLPGFLPGPDPVPIPPADAPTLDDSPPVPDALAPDLLPEDMPAIGEELGPVPPPGFLEVPEDEGELLPPPEVVPSVPLERPQAPREAGSPFAVVSAATRRIINIAPRDSGRQFSVETLTASDGVTTIIVIRGGVSLVGFVPGRGIIDISAENAVLWTRLDLKGEKPPLNPGDATGQLDQNPDQPLEVYLQGNVLFKQDKQEVAGDGDQTVVEAQRVLLRLPYRVVLRRGSRAEPVR